MFPGLAVAECLRRRGHEVTLWLTGREAGHDAVRQWEGAIHEIKAQGFARGRFFQAPAALWSLLIAIWRSRRVLRQDRPDALLGMGSYASVGPCAAAGWLGIPYVVHEANVIPGRANAWLSRRAVTVCASFDETRFYLHREGRLEVTGLPLRADLRAAAESHRWTPDPKGRFRLLIAGGSLGAEKLNTVAARVLKAWPVEGKRLHITHLTGANHLAAVQALYDKRADDWTIEAFRNDMASVYARTDLAVCRAGASTCAELLAFGVPALLAPYPHAIHDHQMMNARCMEKYQCADVIPESELTEAWLRDYLEEHVAHPDRLIKRREAAVAHRQPHSAEAVADVLERAASMKRVSS